MKLENAVAIKRAARRLRENAGSTTVADKLEWLDLILTDLETDIAYYELNIPALDAALHESKAGLDRLRGQWADERAALDRLSQTIEQLLAEAEHTEPKACIDDSFEEEHESFSAAGRSQLLKSNGKTATNNKNEALKKLIESRGKG